MFSTERFFNSSTTSLFDFSHSTKVCSAVVTAKSDQKQDPRQAWNKSGAPLASSDAPGGVTHGISTRLTHPLVSFLESVWVLKFDRFFVVF